MSVYEIDYADLASVPDKIKGKFGFLYAVTAREPWTRKDGKASGLLTLRTCCAECGQPFEQKTGLRARNLLRRCVEHRAAMKPATPAAQAAYDAGRRKSVETQRIRRELRKAGLL